MDELDQVMYGAFFDELEHLEKAGMMGKIGAAPMFLRQAYKGLGTIMNKGPGDVYGKGGLFRKAWQRGADRAGPDAGLLGRAAGGLKGIWGSNVGKATLLGAGTLATGAATAGAGYLAGRGPGSSQNVYVR